MPPITEMMGFKIIEVFAESIPVTVLQVYTILMSEKLDIIVLLALFSSIAFVSEGVTYLTYMKDINEESRRTGKLFYGFMPLSGIRLLLVKVSMYMLSFCQLMGKSVTIALLVPVGGKFLVIVVMICEVAMFLLYKVIRKDFRYWIPLPRGWSMILAITLRVMIKVLTDFTGMLHSRHPYVASEPT